jgi:hypothetical protein
MTRYHKRRVPHRSFREHVRDPVELGLVIHVMLNFLNRFIAKQAADPGDRCGFALAHLGRHAIDPVLRGRYRVSRTGLESRFLDQPNWHQAPHPPPPAANQRHDNEQGSQAEIEPTAGLVAHQGILNQAELPVVVSLIRRPI